MKTETYDLVVIGAGSAAREGASKAKEHGARIAMVERERWGGSCPNVACRPTKAYLVAAELAHDVNTFGERFGLDVGPARVDLARVKARKDSLLSTQEQWRERLTKAGYELVRGVASFENAHTVRVGARRLSAERILVATGSRTAVPPIGGLDAVDWLDHVSALELTELPESLLVVGAGPVGLEFAQALSRYGSEVTVVDAESRIAIRSDADAAAELAAALADEVVVPRSAACCGFAGDRGFLHPELTAAATAPEAAEVEAAGGDAHLCSNRTCEIGMARATGAGYESFLYLLERLTR